MKKGSIEFLKISVKWTSCLWKFKLMTIENHSYAHYCLFFLYIIKPHFCYISAGLMRSTSNEDVSMMGSKYTVVQSAWRFSNINGSSRETNKSQMKTMMKQRWGLDRNVLRRHLEIPRVPNNTHWNTGANENQQLNPGGPSNRQKSSDPNQLK